jgi:hypothetical protein
MFSCFIRFIGATKVGCATDEFLTPRLEAGFCILGVATLSLRGLGDIGCNWVKPGGRGHPLIAEIGKVKAYR